MAQATDSSTNSLASRAAGSLLTREEAFKLATEYGPRAVGAIACFVAGLLLAGWIGKLVTRGLNRREMEPPIRMLIIRFVKLVVLLVALLMAIQQLGFQLLPLIAGLGVAGVGVGLAMQGVLSNLVAGLTIIFVKKFRVGEFIEINGVHGQVDVIELFSTTLVHADRSRVIIPNRKIVGEIIHNFGKIRRAQLTVGIAYNSDVNRALQLIREELMKNPRVLKDPAPIVGTSGLGDSSVNIAVMPWASLADFGPMQAEVNQAILERFRQEGIEIPFPQREIRLLPGSELKTAAA
jgi:small conductance mechanosensitive channel